MVPDFGTYIREYVIGRQFDQRPEPGEHHFVSTYLVPKLYAINGLIPDYVNPDGTKAILGDVVYYRDEKHHLGIEVKLGTIRLTKKEFNEWIVGSATQIHPNVFLGIGRAGIAVTTWASFRKAYVAAVQSKNPGWAPRAIADGYGPMKNVDQLSSHLTQSEWFPLEIDSIQQQLRETQFTAALSSLAGGQSVRSNSAAVAS
jgi:hypothetical protein